MMRFAIPFLAAGLFLAPVHAQGCSSTLTVSGTIAPGATVSIDVTGSLSGALTLIAAGETAGSTTFGFGPLGSFTIDLDGPFLVLPLGITDAAGATGVSFTVPSAIPAGSIPAINLTLQAVSLDLSFGMGPPSLSSCVSNTATLTS